LSRNFPRTSKTASSISSFDACFGPSFINITLCPIFKLHIVLLQKHGRIATLDCCDWPLFGLNDCFQNVWVL
jgi:hypothetical protein